MKKAVILLSGGMDSATLLHYMKNRLGVPEIHALTLLYGQKHFREVEMARWQAENVGVIVHKEIDLGVYGRLITGGSVLTDKGMPVPDLGEIAEDALTQPPTYVPNRNLIFLSLAAAYAEAQGIPDVFYGAQAQDEYGYWDCTNDFVERLNHVLKLNRRNAVTVHAPFVGMRKSDVLKIGLELGVDYDHTWTCYRGEGEACGSCPSCVERTNAFAEAEACN